MSSFLGRRLIDPNRHQLRSPVGRVAETGTSSGTRWVGWRNRHQLQRSGGQRPTTGRRQGQELTRSRSSRAAVRAWEATDVGAGAAGETIERGSQVEVRRVRSETR